MGLEYQLRKCSASSEHFENILSSLRLNTNTKVKCLALGVIVKDSALIFHRARFTNLKHAPVKWTLRVLLQDLRNVCAHSPAVPDF